MIATRKTEEMIEITINKRIREREIEDREIVEIRRTRRTERIEESEK